MPIPAGISEIDVAGLTPIESHKVKPCGIKECISNCEARVIAKVPVSGSTLFVLEVVSVSVRTDMIEADKKTPFEPGLVRGDLLFEVSINGNPPRLNYTRMKYEEILPTPDDFGSDKSWIGTFKEWIESEERRGKITEQEKEHIFRLNEKWSENRNPVVNRAVKEELTAMLKKMVAKD